MKFLSVLVHKTTRVVEYLFLSPKKKSNNIFSKKSMFVVNAQHDLQNLDMDDEQCELNLKFDKRKILQYPGSCSLEYQNQMQFLLEKLLCWDTSKRHANKV